MTLILNCGTTPEGLGIKTWGLGLQTVFLGDYRISMSDFLSAALYVLTNTDLETDDLRIKFVELVRNMQVVKGYMPGESHLEIAAPSDRTSILSGRPFHETIVEAINRASSRDLECLATLIKSTKIPKGHDKIIVAWNKRRAALCWGDEDLGVPASLREQQQVALKKADDKEKGINLNDLQQEVEKLLALLKDPQPGLMTWNELLHERLQSLFTLIAKALGK